MLPEKILEVLCCPLCLGKLTYDARADTLTCQKCDVIYPVRNNIPILIIDEQLRRKASNADR